MSFQSFLGGFTSVAAQLPPEIMADRYLVQVERLIAENDYAAALDTMNEIVALQIMLPDMFHFKYAQVALGAGSSEAAIDSVTKYLATTGRAGEFYRDALELLDEAEAQAAQEALETRVFDGMEFVWVPAGEFRMGSRSSESFFSEQSVRWCGSAEGSGWESMR